ncbi:hypothetical protein [Dehalococcoides mccartyi]|uniref:Uncharacterized protein n=1 Tax=Dehalococcoides mccartyi (strain VS) TaxID=311424 RepID=D2BJP4_DEHMV|nr:hypothetical protein [Dehalococcoides mccartyi]ACZ62544.1 hypothetical protein DhcVS_1446 [Dehalococcoides mccartyi VS]
MWLIMTLAAAIITTAVWYIKSPNDKYKLGFLSLMFWGASIMWLVDHVVAYLQEGGEFLEINQDAAFLGISVIIFGFLVWEIVLLSSDPKGVIKKALTK